MIEKFLDLIEWFFKPPYLLTMPQVLKKARIKTAIRWCFIGLVVGFSLGYCMVMKQVDANDQALRESFYQRRIANGPK